LDFADLNETFFDGALVVASSTALGRHRQEHPWVIVVVFVTLEGGRQRHQHAPGQQNERRLYANAKRRL